MDNLIINQANMGLIEREIEDYRKERGPYAGLPAGAQSINDIRKHYDMKARLEAGREKVVEYFKETA